MFMNILIMYLLFVALILFFFIVADAVYEFIKSKYMNNHKVYDILKRSGGSIKITTNSELILKDEKFFYVDRGNDEKVIEGYTLAFTVNDKAFETIDVNLLLILDGTATNLKFSKPWKKDIEKVLKRKHKKLKKEDKEYEKSLNIKNKKINLEMSNEYKRDKRMT